MNCEKCGKLTTTLKFYKEKSGWCPTCFYADDVVLGRSTMISTDEIPGGMYIKHGICNEDGTPKRYDSKSEIKRAAFNAGYTISGDTPKVNNRISDQRAAEKEKRESRISSLRSR